MPIGKQVSRWRSIDGYVVGAYAASPAHREWFPELEAEYLHQLEQDMRIAGLELPWMGRLHPHDDDWLIEHLPTRFDVVLTDIPRIMNVLLDDAQFGLASSDADGRQRAIIQTARLRDDVKRLNDSLGRSTVAAVELHSAPRATGSAAALEESLATICEWDWDGASLVLEHCDAWKQGQTPEKGFLSLDDEIRAIEMCNVNVGISINWGRSAIEFRGADRVPEHIALARSQGLLAGLMISGAADRDSAFGTAWIDAHHPFKKSEQHPHGVDESLLTFEHVVECLASAGPLAWSGVKVGWPAQTAGTVTQRVDMIKTALDACDEARRLTISQ